ncbi:MAG: alcohol dehydrogenase catalytic domain-containing protein [Planctomycetota bacterium]
MPSHPLLEPNARRGATNCALVRRARGVSVEARAAPPAPGPDELSLRVLVAGLCRTDVSVARGALAVAEPRVIGHECAAIVEAVGAEVRHVAPGDVVTLVPLVGCGACDTCRAHAPRGRWRCAAAQMLGVDRDGVFTERLVAPAACAVRAPAGVDPRRVALVEPLAAVTAVLETGLQLAGSIGVTGTGRIAELTRRVLRHAGIETTDEGPADIVIETGGTQGALAHALQRARRGGIVILKCRPPTPLALDVALVVRRELRLIGAAYGDFDAAMALAADPSLPLEDLFGATLPLTEFERACRDGERQKVFFAPGPCAG